MSSFVSRALGLALCASAGFAGAFAAVFGKFAGQEGLEWKEQALFYFLLIACNGLMLVLYTRSLRHQSSLAATATTTAFNISSTGLLGRAVFGEGTSLQWWAGASSIILGSVLVQRAQKKAAAEAAAAAAEAAAEPAAAKVEEEEEGSARKPGSGPSLEQQQLEQQQQQQQQQQQLEQQAGGERREQQDGADDASFSHYTVTLAYDGTDYWGWQLQPAPAKGRRAKPTIQLRLEAALVKMTGEPREVLKVQAAGRTDTGVHARGQVAEWRHRGGPRDPAALLRGLNAWLPADIRALRVREAAPDFNVRYATCKTYSYDVHLGEVADPFTRRFRHHPRRPDRLRLEALADALPLLRGTHDFSAFSNWSDEGARKSAVKTIHRYELLPIDNGVRLEVEGTGFLYKQVRHMTGALLAVASGQLGPDAIEAALAAGPQARTGPARNAARRWMLAEACGLCLQHVSYAPSSPLPPPPGAQP